MNAGSGFWHAEETLADDPPLRMLQIFVRPHSLGLEPNIQHEPIPDPVPGEWRHLFGPTEGDAPLYVRNDVDFYDCRLAAGERVGLPGRSGGDTSRSDWDTYLYVFEGWVTVAERAETNDGDASGEGESAAVGFTESALVTGDGDVEVTAEEDSILVAFRLDPDATITRRGTIGR
jgi:redox-sensitive bicupin YhaK (pirin superfamily)